MTRDLSPLLAPRSLVVIGASEDETRIGGRPLQLARRYGFQGAVYGINPKYQTVQGFACFPSIDALPDAPDLAILAIGAKDVLSQLQACARKGIRAAVVFAGGFAELGTEDGRKLQADLVAFAERSGMLICGPNAIGLVNVRRNAYATFMTAMHEAQPKPGNVALIAQSGGACIAVYNATQKRGVGFNYIINTGNEAVIRYDEYLRHAAEDPDTKVVSGYIEGLDNGPAFVEALQLLRRRDIPVVLYKVGETAAGADAASSHTARLAGNHAVFRTALAQLGAMYAHDMEQLAELTYLCTFAKRRAGRRVGILTTSGAFAAILTDQLVGQGMEVPALSSTMQEQLKPHLPAISILSNPVDITANVVNSVGGFEQALRLMLASDELDCLILFSTSNLIDKLAPAILNTLRDSDKMLAIMVTGDAGTSKALEAAGAPVFQDTGRGSAALATFARWSGHRHAAWSDFGAGYQAAPDFPVTTLNEKQAKDLLADHGLDVAREFSAASEAEAAEAAHSIGFPVVLKILSADITHKSEIGGVRLNLSDEFSLRSAYRAILAAANERAPDARIEGVLVQRQENAGVEMLLSVRRDPLFGPVLFVGFGGVTAELLQDVSQRVLPIDADAARAMLEELRLFPLLQGYRGRPAVDMDALIGAMLRLSGLAVDLGNRLEEIEINPLILRSRDAGGAVAVDCIAKLRQIPAVTTGATIAEAVTCS